ncbi:ferritin family protein [Tumebacillus lipolyticus]|uniref:Ferritin family protein n=1 Tax=Tumebacillus lipolyticus TaxID=1280370 RepID=A0ABW4ZVJ8_9BACL
MYDYGYWTAIPAYHVSQRTGTAQTPFTDQARFLRMVRQAISDERQAQQFYRLLAERANSKFQKEQIDHAYEDEVKHEKMLIRLYSTITGQSPHVSSAQAPELADYLTGIRKAFTDELQAAEMYRDLYLMSNLPWVRDIFFELITDEMEHASRFAFIRAEL